MHGLEKLQRECQKLQTAANYKNKLFSYSVYPLLLLHSYFYPTFLIVYSRKLMVCQKSHTIPQSYLGEMGQQGKAFMLIGLICWKPNISGKFQIVCTVGTKIV